MAKGKHHFSRTDFVAFATRHTFGDAVAVAESIDRSGPRQGDEVTSYLDGGLFLEGEELALYRELKRIAYRKLRNARKAELRASQGKPYGQGAYTRIIPGDEREPIDRPSKYRTVDKPKPHGPSDHVKRWTTGKDK